MVHMPVITIIEVKCKDCYKCVRACPMKAIKIEGGHAHIIEERCISDGSCLNVCPQEAKRVSSDLDLVKEWLSSGERVAASIAPSFPAFFDLSALVRPSKALRCKGFSLVQETSVGAELVAREHAQLISRTYGEPRFPLLTSSCPAVINMIEKHYPEVIPYVAPVVSPMIAHGRYIKTMFNEVDRVVFIGPCVAKRDELGRSCNNTGRGRAIDAVLTFPEVEHWLGIEASCQPDEATSAGEAEMTGVFDGPEAVWAKMFPIAGGLPKAAALSTDMTSRDILSVWGVEECCEVLEEVRARAESWRERAGEISEPGSHKGAGLTGQDASPHVLPKTTSSYLERVKLIELLSCQNGCISGPLMDDGVSTVARRAKVVDYARQRIESLGAGETLRLQNHWEKTYKDRCISLSASFSNRCVKYPDPPESVILEILAKTDKTKPEDELNCGACGYDSCREKARAVYYGFAEVEMCIPYMRAKAESFSDAVINSAPDGVVVVDNDLRVLSVNPAFEKTFLCKESNMKMKKLDYLFDTRYFKEAMRTKKLVIADASYPSYNVMTRQFVFPIEKHGVVVGILRDLTLEQKNRQELELLRQETLERAQAVIEKQMRVAQEIAGLLGETTAETKVLLMKLIQIVSSGEGSNNHASVCRGGDVPTA
jgi:iron only hydrogenase large subunit-like protein/uncharacterized Fe-S cluster-containing protein